MPTPVMPTLSKGTRDLIEDPSSVCIRLIAFSLQNPGSTSSMIEGELVSFRKLRAEFGDRRDALASAYAQRLQNAVNNYFPSAGYYVTAQTQMIDQSSYRLIVGIFDSNGSLLTTNNARVAGDVITIDN